MRDIRLLKRLIAGGEKGRVTSDVFISKALKALFPHSETMGSLEVEGILSAEDVMLGPNKQEE